MISIFNLTKWLIWISAITTLILRMEPTFTNILYWSSSTLIRFKLISSQLFRFYHLLKTRTNCPYAENCNFFGYIFHSPVYIYIYIHILLLNFLQHFHWGCYAWKSLKISPFKKKLSFGKYSKNKDLGLKFFKGHIIRLFHA